MLAEVWPEAELALLEGSARRAAFLRAALVELGRTGERVHVVEGRAEDHARDPGLEHHFDVVVARSFGLPAVTAECGARLLCPSGRLVVSEPPGDQPACSERWPSGPLAELGLSVEAATSGPPAFVALRSERPCPDRYPRRAGMPAKRPLF